MDIVGYSAGVGLRPVCSGSHSHDGRRICSGICPDGDSGCKAVFADVPHRIYAASFGGSGSGGLRGGCLCDGRTYDFESARRGVAL